MLEGHSADEGRVMEERRDADHKIVSAAGGASRSIGIDTIHGSHYQILSVMNTRGFAAAQASVKNTAAIFSTCNWNRDIRCS